MTWTDIEPVTAVMANVATVATAIVAVLFFAGYHHARRAKRRRLENHLKAEAAEWDRVRTGPYACTVPQLVHVLGMTETEIVDASFRSKCIFRRMSRREPGQMTLEYMSPDQIAEEREIELARRNARPSWWNVRI